MLCERKLVHSYWYLFLNVVYFFIFRFVLYFWTVYSSVNILQVVFDSWAVDSFITSPTCWLLAETGCRHKEVNNLKNVHGCYGLLFHVKWQWLYPFYICPWRLLCFSVSNSLKYICTMRHFFSIGRIHTFFFPVSNCFIVIDTSTFMR